MITQQSELAQFVRDIRAGGPAGFAPAVTEFLNVLSDSHPSDNDMVRLSVILGFAMNWSDLAQDSIEAVLERLSNIDSGPNENDFRVLEAGFWLICKRTLEFDSPAQFALALPALAVATEDDIWAAVSNLLNHEEILENCRIIYAGYAKFGNRVWYREIVEESLAYLADRRGLRADQQLGFVFLFSCWDVSESKLSPWLVRKLYESRNIPSPLLLGLIFKLTPDFHAACVRRGKHGSLRTAICKQFSGAVQIALDAMLT